MVALGRDRPVRPLAEHLARQVALPGVGHRGDDRRELGMLLGDLQRRGHVDPTRRSGEDPLLAREPVRHLQRLVRGSGHDPVHERQVEVVGHDAVADPRHAVGAPPLLGDQRALGRLDREGADRPVVRLEGAGDPRDPPPGPLRSDHGVDLAAALLPDLLPRGRLRIGVVGILELTRHEVTLGIGGDDLTHLRDREVDVGPRPRREDELGPVGLDHPLAFEAHATRHHDHAVIALDRGDGRARDPGVAGRRLDDRHAGPQVAALLGPLDHRAIDPILRRARRAVPLDLGEQAEPLGRHAGQADERRSPDRVEHRGKRSGVGVPDERLGALHGPV